MKKSDVERRIGELEKKYFDLVWYARSKPSEPLGKSGRERISKALPEECARLSGAGGDWEHGFNSGCLAALRLVQGLLGSAADAQQAEEEFPFLDT